MIPPRYALDPTLSLYLPLYLIDDKTIRDYSKTGYPALANRWSRDGAFWTPQGHSFDGVDDNLATNLNTQILDSAKRQGTVAFWLYPRAFVDSVNSPSFWFGMEGSQDFTFNFGNTSGRWHWGCWAVDLNSGSVVGLLNKWQHVVGTYGLFGTKLYVDGIQVATSATQPGSVSQLNGTYIGSKRTGVHFNGLIKEVLIMERGLFPVEVSTLYINSKRELGL